VLVRLPNWLGDAVMARPALHALRAAWPDAQVLGVGLDGPCAPLRDEGLFDAWASWTHEAAGRRGALEAARAFAPDLALVLPPSFSSAWFAWRSGARTRVGFRGDARRVLLSDARSRAARGDRHQSDEFLDLLAPYGVREVPVPLLRPREESRAIASGLLAARGVNGGHAVMGPRSAFGPAREWFPDRFIATGRALVQRGLHVLVCGTAAERESCARVAQGIGAGAVDLSGETTLPVLTALVADARLAVCNDSGLAHLAAACGAPTLQLYGSAASGWTAARGPHVRILHRAPVCSPCWQRRCRIGTVCLEAITAEHVVQVADRLMAGAA
jgi:heptosyltransferase-2